jgi:hypothetical protein
MHRAKSTHPAQQATFYFWVRLFELFLWSQWPLLMFCIMSLYKCSVSLGNYTQPGMRCDKTWVADSKVFKTTSNHWLYHFPCCCLDEYEGTYKCFAELFMRFQRLIKCLSYTFDRLLSNSHEWLVWHGVMPAKKKNYCQYQTKKIAHMSIFS